MYVTLFRFALPGGRRVIISYARSPSGHDDPPRPIRETEPPRFDRFLASGGIHYQPPGQTERPRGKRIR